MTVDSGGNAYITGTSTSLDFPTTPGSYQTTSLAGGSQAIITKIAATGIRRIVFTGGDPLQRADVGTLIRHAAAQGLEVAVSTTGDVLTASFLDDYGADIDLVSLPLDGSNEEVSSRTKQPGHFAAVMSALDLLERHPGIDVKVATPVTRHNIDDVPRIVELLDERSGRLSGRLFYNAFQAFPRSMSADVDWSASTGSTTRPSIGCT